ncbi:hypothetical protein ERJ75_001375400 [Trypanosoma vivax]|nr:hypothetical protein ERJ75_001375400 [Trypanosoma vivax]
MQDVHGRDTRHSGASLRVSDGRTQLNSACGSGRAKKAKLRPYDNDNGVCTACCALVLAERVPMRIAGSMLATRL